MRKACTFRQVGLDGVGGNGGLSLRRRSKMLEIIEACRYWFARAGSRPYVRQDARVCVRQADGVGVHACARWTVSACMRAPDGRCRRVCARQVDAVGVHACASDSMAWNEDGEYGSAHARAVANARMHT
jgi:hypothetical protein